MRKDGLYREEDDIVEAWSLNGYVEKVILLMVFFLMYFRHHFLSDDEIEELDLSRDKFLGPAELMTSELPKDDPTNPGSLIGGTAFERCGQHPVKDFGRCYSLSMTHQRQRALVGPTSGGKYFGGLEDDNHSRNLEIRQHITKVSLDNRFLLYNNKIKILYLDKCPCCHEGAQNRCAGWLYEPSRGACGYG